MDRSDRTDTEQRLLEIWSEILATDRVGMHDHFLDAGGDSFGAMRCINQIKAAFDVELPLDIFFGEPASIVAIAAEVDQVRRRSADARQASVSNDRLTTEERKPC